MPNYFVHVEIPCTDFERAKTFYEGVFDWKTRYMAEQDYMLFETGGDLNGGFYKSPEHVGRQGVVNYLKVDDLEKTLKTIELYGGKIIMPSKQVTETGWFALFGDPDGNVLGLWKDAL